MDNLIAKWKDIVRGMNSRGIPVPLLRDSRTQKGSATLTMFWLSFNLCLISLIGKYSKQFEGIDINNSLQLLMITGGFYLGRSIVRGKDGKVEAPSEAKPEDPKPPQE